MRCEVLIEGEIKVGTAVTIVSYTNDGQLLTISARKVVAVNPDEQTFVLEVDVPDLGYYCPA